MEGRAYNSEHSHRVTALDRSLSIVIARAVLGWWLGWTINGSYEEGNSRRLGEVG